MKRCDFSFKMHFTECILFLSCVNILGTRALDELASMDVGMQEASLKRGAAALDEDAGNMPGLWAAAKKQTLAPALIGENLLEDDAPTQNLLQDQGIFIRKWYKFKRNRWIAEMIRINSQMAANSQGGRSTRAQCG